MSKPTIKFIYTGQFRSQVKQMHKGPPKLQNLYDSYIHPQYIKIQNTQQSESNAQIISKVQVNSKPNSPNGMNRYKSADNIHHQKQQNSNLIINIEQKDSQTITFNNKQTNIKKPKDNHEQIIINAPSYKFIPRKEGQISVFTKRQFLKNGIIQKFLNGQANTKTKKHLKNPNNQKQLQIKSQDPLQKLQVIKQRQFKTDNYDSQINAAYTDDKIVLKAPGYKYKPCQEGTIAVNKKKQYSKTQNKQKYLYNGIENRQQSQFVSCFDCKEPRIKKYKAQDY